MRETTFTRTSPSESRGSYVVNSLMLLGRVCFTTDFVFFGLRKASNPAVVMKMLEGVHLPAILVYPTIALQVCGGLLVLVGLLTEYAAGMLCIFCFVAATLFWRDVPLNLVRDYAAGSGLLLLAFFGPGRYSVDHWQATSSWQPRVPVNWLIDRCHVYLRLTVCTIASLPLLVRAYGVMKQGLTSLDNSNQALYATAAVFGAIELVLAYMLIRGRRLDWVAVIAAAVWLVDSVLTRRPEFYWENHALLTDKVSDLWISFSKDITTVGALFILAAHAASLTRGNWRATNRAAR